MSRSIGEKSARRHSGARPFGREPGIHIPGTAALSLTDKVTFLPKALVSAPMYVAFSKQSKCSALRPAFAAALRNAFDGGKVTPLLEAADKRAGN